MVQAGLINQKTKRKLHELKLPTFQIAFAFIKQLDLAIECSCSLLLSRQLGRTSNISTLCPLIRNERSTSRRMCGGWSSLFYELGDQLLASLHIEFTERRDWPVPGVGPAAG